MLVTAACLRYGRGVGLEDGGWRGLQRGCLEACSASASMSRRRLGAPRPTARDWLSAVRTEDELCLAVSTYKWHEGSVGCLSAAPHGTHLASLMMLRENAG